MVFQQKDVFISLVREISRTIGENVIFTDESGLIIASTKEDRMGAYHEGAELAMSRKTPMHMTAERASRLKGVRKGVVTPIFVSGKPIGVVGITGEPVRIEPFILIVQRMAELFIKSTIDQINQEKLARNMELFIFDWVNSSIMVAELHEYSDFYKINLPYYRQAILFETPEIQSLTVEDISMLQTLWDTKGEPLFVRWGHGKLLLLDRIRTNKEISLKLASFLPAIHSILGEKITIGVGQTSSYLEIGRSVKQAELAAAHTSGVQSIIFEEDLVFELVQDQLNKETKQLFMERTIAPIMHDEALIETLEMWFYYRMRTEITAKALHIHKNTLYYRLQKIEKATRLKMDEMQDIVLLYMALQFQKETRI